MSLTQFRANGHQDRTAAIPAGNTHPAPATRQQGQSHPSMMPAGQAEETAGTWPHYGHAATLVSAGAGQRQTAFNAGQHAGPPGGGGAPGRTPPRSIPQASTPSQRNQASTSRQGTGQGHAAGALGAGAGTESRPKADRLRGKEGRELLSMNEFLSLLSYLSPQSPRIVPTLSPHPLSPSHPLSIGVLSRSGHLSPRPHKN